MKTKNLVKALEKIGVKVTVKERWSRDLRTGQKEQIDSEVYGDNGKNKISFYDRSGEAECVQVMGINCRNDYMSDYFPGFFASTIKSAINGMVR